MTPELEKKINSFTDEQASIIESVVNKFEAKFSNLAPPSLADVSKHCGVEISELIKLPIDNLQEAKTDCAKSIALRIINDLFSAIADTRLLTKEEADEFLAEMRRETLGF